MACSTTAVQGLCCPPEERSIASPALALTREAMHLKSCIAWVNGATASQRAAVVVAVSLVPVTAREVGCSTTAVQGLCCPPEERSIASPALALTREAMHLKSCITWVNGATAFQRAAVVVAVSLVPVTARSGL